MDQYLELRVFKLVSRKGIDPKRIMGSLWAYKIKFDEKGVFDAAFPTPPQNDNSEVVFRNQKRASERESSLTARGPLGLAQASPNTLNTHDTQ